MKKGEGSQVKESTDSSTTLEDDDIKGKSLNYKQFFFAKLAVQFPLTVFPHKLAHCENICCEITFTRYIILYLPILSVKSFIIIHLLQISEKYILFCNQIYYINILNTIFKIISIK